MPAVKQPFLGRPAPNLGTVPKGVFRTRINNNNNNNIIIINNNIINI
jgi:hypothetical protein